jgi:predicted TIM-barrel fold metal-dependent hydrolase
MEGIRFFDSNVFIGTPMIAGTYAPAESAGKLLETMDKAGIEKAMVWHVAQHDSSPVYGNNLLSEEVSGRERLLGTWTAIPPQTGEVVKEGFFGEMKRNRIYGLRMFPASHSYLLNRVSCGKFLDEVSERKIPLFLSISRRITWQDVYDIMAQFPYLTCVVCDIGSWSPMRNLLPLLDRYPGFYVETSMLSLHEGNIEFIVKRNGSDRILFGTGFPEKYIESNTLELLHAEIPLPDKQNIASLNLERIISEVKL